MSSLSDKVASILPLLESRGQVYLFALAERENIDRWDIILSADWSDENWAGTIRYIADLLGSRLEPQEKTMIAQIAVISPNDPNMQSLPKNLDGIVPEDNKTVSVELLRSDIRSAYIFKATHPPKDSPGTVRTNVETIAA